MVLLVSHPVRVRGLKLQSIERENIQTEVAPRAGAWIETHVRRLFKLLLSVAPPCGCFG